MSGQVNQNPDKIRVFSLPGEEWKDVDGYEGYYQVSNMGRVKSLERKIKMKISIKIVSEKIINTPSNGNGYVIASLRKGKSKNHLIHRLVANAFLPPVQGNLIVNHKNGIKDDNRAENLEWSNTSENMNHAYGLGLKVSEKGEKHGRSKLTDLEVIEIRKSTKTQIQLADFYSVSLSTISYVVNRRTWKHLK